MPEGEDKPIEVEEMGLAHFLASRDVPCPSCDYNLRGLKGDVCPECSQRLVLRVGLAEPRQRAFVAAVVALAMGTGFQGLLFVYFLIRAALDPSMFRDDGLRFFCLTFVPFAIEGPALLTLIRRRRGFQRRSDRFKGWIVAGAWILTLVGFVIFTFFIK
jgi:hypothetical protein